MGSRERFKKPCLKLVEYIKIVKLNPKYGLYFETVWKTDKSTPYYQVLLHIPQRIIKKTKHTWIKICSKKEYSKTFLLL